MTDGTHRFIANRDGFPQAGRAPALLALPLPSIIRSYAASLARRSMAIVRFLDCRMGTVALAWLAVFAFACLPRLLFPLTPVQGIGEAALLALPYLLISLTPLAGFAIAAGSFPRGVLTAQPAIRLSHYGRWRQLTVLEVRSNPLFGPAGFMASLLIGLLLNVVVRSVEFLLAMPAMGGTAPLWGYRLFALMAADVAVVSFFYSVCFVMALRSVPLFPRMLLFAWGIDMLMQVAIAEVVGATPGLPGQVAWVLHGLLEGNLTKAGISVAVWLPYLILSDRVNVTYRHRELVARKELY